MIEDSKYVIVFDPLQTGHVSLYFFYIPGYLGDSDTERHESLHSGRAVSQNGFLPF